jgi:hypothetical protein
MTTPAPDTLLVLVTHPTLTQPRIYGPFASVEDRQQLVDEMRDLAFNVRVLTLTSPEPFLAGVRGRRHDCAAHGDWPCAKG